MHRLTKKGLVTLLMTSMMLVFSPSQIALADDDYVIGDSTSFVMEYEEDFDESTLSIQDAPTYEKFEGGEVSGLSNSDAFDYFGKIWVKVGNGSLTEVEFDDSACVPVPNNPNSSVIERFTTNCPSNPIGGLSVTVDVDRWFNWFRWTVYVSHSSSTDPITIYVGGDLHRSDSKLEFAENGTWVTSDNFEGYGTDSIVGLRSEGASLYRNTSDSVWTSGSEGFYFKKTTPNLSTTSQLAIDLEGFAVGWNRTDGETKPAVFSAARDCAIDLIQPGVSFGTLQPFFTTADVECMAVQEFRVDTETVAVTPTDNPSRAIGEGFTFQGRNLNRVDLVSCNGVDSRITSRSQESLTIRVPAGVTGQVNCLLTSSGILLLANNAFSALDGPVARYVKAVRGGKINLRIYNAVGRKIQIQVDGTTRSVITPKKINTFVQLSNISVGKHKLVVKTSGKELLNRSFRAR